MRLCEIHYLVFPSNILIPFVLLRSSESALPYQVLLVSVSSRSGSPKQKGWTWEAMFQNL